MTDDLTKLAARLRRRSANVHAYLDDVDGGCADMRAAAALLAEVERLRADRAALRVAVEEWPKDIESYREMKSAFLMLRAALAAHEDCCGTSDGPNLEATMTDDLLAEVERLQERFAEDNGNRTTLAEAAATFGIDLDRLDALDEMLAEIDNMRTRKKKLGDRDGNV